MLAGKTLGASGHFILLASLTWSPQTSFVEGNYKPSLR